MKNIVSGECANTMQGTSKFSFDAISP